MGMQLFWTILLFGSPLIAGIIVAVAKPAFAVSYTDRFNAWLSVSQAQAASKDSHFNNFLVKPVAGSIIKIAEWTQGIKDDFWRCGVRIATYLYFVAAFVALIVFSAYLLAMIVLTVAIVWFVFKVVFAAVSSSDNEHTGPTQRGVAIGVRNQDIASVKQGFLGDYEGETVFRVKSDGSIVTIKDGLFGNYEGETVFRIKDDGDVVSVKEGFFGNYEGETVLRIKDDGNVISVKQGFLGGYEGETIMHVKGDGRIVAVKQGLLGDYEDNTIFKAKG